MPTDATSLPRPSDFVIVLVTIPTADAAASLANTVVAEKLVACVNILPGLRSIYSWKGAVCDESEVLCILKTQRALFPKLCERVQALHPYDVPEIIALPLAAGHAPYLAWLAAETRIPG